MKKFTLLATALSLFAFAFAASNPAKVNTKNKKTSDLLNAPEWIIKPESEFDSRLYLTGVGHSEEEDASEDEAKAALIQTLITQISANEKSFQFADKDSEYASITSTINTTSELKSIKGLRIVNKFKSESGIYYALAVVKKQDAVDFYAKQIEKNNEKIKENIDFAENHKGYFQSVVSAHNVYQLVKENEYYFYLIDIIDSPFPTEVNTTYKNTASVKNFITKIQQECRVKIVVENDYKNLIKTSITDCFNHMGFITTDKDNAAILVKAIVDIEKFDSPDEKHVFYNYLLTSDMTIVKTETVVNTFSIHGRAGHLNDQGARNKAYLTLAQDIDKQFKSDLEKFIED